MWYEILPSLGIMVGALAIPPFATAASNWFLGNGKLCGRDWDRHLTDFHMYLRDRRITGSEYVPQGLEAVPDKD